MKNTATEPQPSGGAGHQVSLGGILDDISDAVSFCIVPAWIYYLLLGAASDPRLAGIPCGMIALAYAVLGIARLIYFTIDRTPVPGFFKGMPTPAAALMVVAPMINFQQAVQDAPQWVPFWALFCTAIMLFAGIVMNLYPVRYMHMGRAMDRHPWLGRACLFVLLMSIFTPFFGHIAFLILFLYVLSPLVTWRLQPQDCR